VPATVPIDRPLRNLPRVTFPALAALLLLAAALPRPGFPAEVEATIPLSVDLYARAVAEGNTVRVDTLFARGLRAAADLAGPEGVIADLDDADYDTVVVRMSGFFVNRNEVEYVEPDPAVFLARARARSDTLSVAFFEAYRRSVSASFLPAYFEPTTDYSGCVKFGSLALVEGYGRWTAFRDSFPDGYAEQVTDFIGAIETILTAGDCACGEKDSVLKELNAFLRAYPKAAAADRVRHRIEAVESGRAHVKYGCYPG
jgi:hypothetical protein